MSPSLPVTAKDIAMTATTSTHKMSLPRYFRLVLFIFVTLGIFFSLPYPNTRLAYFIQISPTNHPLLPRLLSALYTPENHYMLHFDIAIPRSTVHSTLLATFSTLPSTENVHILPSEPITYRGITMTLNFLSGLTALLPYRWSHFINLSAADYPTSSQHIIRKLLSRARGKSFLEWKPRPTWQVFQERRLGEWYIDTALGKINTPGEYIKPSMIPNPLALALQYVFAKSSGWVILSRPFCEFLLADSWARKVLLSLTFSDASDEHLFASVAYNTKWRKDVVPDNLRSIFFVAPNGSFAMGRGGVRSRQHPFWVDEVDENGEFLFWNTLVSNPGFFTRKLREDGSFRDRVDKELLVEGSAYEARLEERYMQVLSRSGKLS